MTALRRVFEIGAAYAAASGVVLLIAAILSAIYNREWYGTIACAIVGAYSWYVAFLVTKRFSPLAIRHACAYVSLMFIAIPNIIWGFFPGWVSMLSLLVLIYAGILFYRRNSACFIQVFFPEKFDSPDGVSAIDPSVTKATTPEKQPEV